MRAIYQFGKTRRLMCVSHLDLQRFMQMALRRSALPVAYSQGFNPHPLLSFASALAMGWTSEAELMDIKLAAPLGKAAALEQMRRALPPDLPLRGVRLVEDRFPALMARLYWADYAITLPGPAWDKVAQAVPGFLAEKEVIALRKTKSGEKPADIRPMALSLEVTPQGGGYLMRARLQLTERATLKPDLLLSVLAQRAGAQLPQDAQVHRTALLAQDDSGAPVDLFTLKA